MFPSSSLNGLNTRGVGIGGVLETTAIVWSADEEMDFETGLFGLELLLVEELERERRCCNELRDVGLLCCVHPATWIKSDISRVAPSSIPSSRLLEGRPQRRKTSPCGNAARIPTEGKGDYYVGLMDD